MHDSFRRVIDGLESDREQAATEVVYLFADRLIGLARSRLNQRFQKLIDADDVMQSVFRTFFRRQNEGQFDLENWDALWSLLVVITIRKCGKQVQSLQAACRDVRREWNPQSPSDSATGQFELVTREPSPEEVLSMTETLEQLMAELNHKDQETLSLRLSGHTFEEISKKVNRTERTVFRTMEHVKSKLVQLMECERQV